MKLLYKEEAPDWGRISSSESLGIALKVASGRVYQIGEYRVKLVTYLGTRESNYIYGFGLVWTNSSGWVIATSFNPKEIEKEELVDQTLLERLIMLLDGE